MRDNSAFKNALLSVYDKTGLVDFACRLVGLGYTIYASGGTYKKLQEFGVPAIDIATLVGEPILNHRVVTLSREIMAGLLATRSDKDLEELKKINAFYIDLVCVDLYPLEAEIAREGATLESVTELTDVGGPTMLHAAAKGRRIVVSSPAARKRVLVWLENGMPAEEAFRLQLAGEAERVAARHIGASADYLQTENYKA